MWHYAHIEKKKFSKLLMVTLKLHHKFFLGLSACAMMLLTRSCKNAATPAAKVRRIEFEIFENNNNKKGNFCMPRHLKLYRFFIFHSLIINSMNTRSYE